VARRTAPPTRNIWVSTFRVTSSAWRGPMPMTSWWWPTWRRVPALLGTIDLAVSWQVFEHVRPLDVALDNLHHLSSPGAPCPGPGSPDTWVDKVIMPDRADPWRATRERPRGRRSEGLRTTIATDRSSARGGQQALARLERRAASGSVALEQPLPVVGADELPDGARSSSSVSKRSIQSTCSLSVWMNFSTQPLVSGS